MTEKYKSVTPSSDRFLLELLLSLLIPFGYLLLVLLHIHYARFVIRILFSAKIQINFRNFGLGQFLIFFFETSNFGTLMSNKDKNKFAPIIEW